MEPNQNKNVKFLWLDKNFAYYFASFMASKAKTTSFCALIRQAFVPCFYAGFMAIKFELTSFSDLIKTLLLVLLLNLWLQKPKQEVSKT